jgi:hypothetical protein
MSISRTSRATDRRRSCSARTRQDGLRRTWQSYRSYCVRPDLGALAASHDCPQRLDQPQRDAKRANDDLRGNHDGKNYDPGAARSGRVVNAGFQVLSLLAVSLSEYVIGGPSMV